jgi:hypothetical protein
LIWLRVVPWRDMVINLSDNDIISRVRFNTNNCDDFVNGCLLTKPLINILVTDWYGLINLLSDKLKVLLLLLITELVKSNWLVLR